MAASAERLRIMSNSVATTPAGSPSERTFTWFHGSPFILETLAAGSTITPNRELARIFSHKPELVVIEDDGGIRHNGRLPGYLYTIAEEITPEDVYAHPHSSMPGQEWLTRRGLTLQLIEQTAVVDDELIGDDEQRALRERYAEMTRKPSHG